MHRPAFVTTACILVCAGLLFAGLWPFNFRVDNRAELTPRGGGLRFDAPAASSKQNKGGMVFTPSPLACPSKEGCQAGSIAIEIELRADSELSGCIKRIMEVRRPDGSEAFYIGQWKSFLIMRSLNTPPVGGKAYREMGVAGVLAAGRRSIVAIASGSYGTEFHIDGRLVRSYPGARLLKADETLEGHKLYLGNAPDLSCPWAGSVLRLSIYGGTRPPSMAAEGQDSAENGSIAYSENRIEAIACYRFEEMAGDFIADLSGSGNALWKPKRLIFEKQFLGLPDGQSFSIMDLAVNLAGFIPFGLVVCLRLLMAGRLSARNSFFVTLAIGFSVSLVIETAQVWLPGRDSSLLDIGANSAGTGMGGVVYAQTKRLRSG